MSATVCPVLRKGLTSCTSPRLGISSFLKGLSAPPGSCSCHTELGAHLWFRGPVMILWFWSDLSGALRVSVAGWDGCMGQGPHRRCRDFHFLTCGVLSRSSKGRILLLRSQNCYRRVPVIPLCGFCFAQIKIALPQVRQGASLEGRPKLRTFPKLPSQEPSSRSHGLWSQGFGWNPNVTVNSCVTIEGLSDLSEPQFFYCK